jgi:hypothetical protein
LDPLFAAGFSRPVSSKILSENLNAESSRISFRDILLDFVKRIMESIDKDRGVHEILKEKRGNIFTGNWDFVGDEIVSSCVLDVVGLEVVYDGEIGAVDFLCGDPKDVLFFGFGFSDGFGEFRAGEGVDGGVVLEFGEEVGLVLHFVDREMEIKITIHGRDFFCILKGGF